MKYIIGNWKMNKTLDEATDFIMNLRRVIDKNKNFRILIAPPIIYLPILSKSFNTIDFVSQNVSFQDFGAYTGEVSANMLQAYVHYSLIGHSERREYFNETNQDLKMKVDLALSNNLDVIFCCGESLEQRESHIHFDWIKSQIEESLFHLTEEEFSKIVIAYEPIWAIGTGVTASSSQAEEVHAFIRGVISDKYGENVSGNCSILYGGSCNPNNSRELFSKENIDGGLIGGASLDANSFVEIIKSF